MIVGENVRNCKMTTQEGRKKKLRGRTKEIRHLIARHTVFAKSDSDNIHQRLTPLTDLLEAAKSKYRKKKKKNTQRTSRCSGGGFAGTLHPQTHTLLHDSQRHCSSFLKGKVNRKKKTVAVLSDLGKNTHALTQTRTEQQQIHTLMSALS